MQKRLVLAITLFAAFAANTPLQTAVPATPQQLFQEALTDAGLTFSTDAPIMNNAELQSAFMSVLISIRDNDAVMRDFAITYLPLLSGTQVDSFTADRVRFATHANLNQTQRELVQMLNSKINKNGRKQWYETPAAIAALSIGSVAVVGAAAGGIWFARERSKCNGFLKDPANKVLFAQMVRAYEAGAEAGLPAFEGGLSDLAAVPLMVVGKKGPAQAAYRAKILAAVRGEENPFGDNPRPIERDMLKIIAEVQAQQAFDEYAAAFDDVPAELTEDTIAAARNQHWLMLAAIAWVNQPETVVTADVKQQWNDKAGALRALIEAFDEPSVSDAVVLATSAFFAGNTAVLDDVPQGEITHANLDEAVGFLERLRGLCDNGRSRQGRNAQHDEQLAAWETACANLRSRIDRFAGEDDDPLLAGAASPGGDREADDEGVQQHVEDFATTFEEFGDVSESNIAAARCRLRSMHDAIARMPESGKTGEHQATFEEWQAAYANLTQKIAAFERNFLDSTVVPAFDGIGDVDTTDKAAVQEKILECSSALDAVREFVSRENEQLQALQADLEQLRINRVTAIRERVEELADIDYEVTAADANENYQEILALSRENAALLVDITSETFNKQGAIDAVVRMRDAFNKLLDTLEKRDRLSENLGQIRVSAIAPDSDREVRLREALDRVNAIIAELDAVEDYQAALTQVKAKAQAKATEIQGALAADADANTANKGFLAEVKSAVEELMPGKFRKDDASEYTQGDIVRIDQALAEADAQCDKISSAQAAGTLDAVTGQEISEGIQLIQSELEALRGRVAEVLAARDDAARLAAHTKAETEKRQALVDALPSQAEIAAMSLGQLGSLPSRINGIVTTEPGVNFGDVWQTWLDRVDEVEGWIVDRQEIYGELDEFKTALAGFSVDSYNAKGDGAIKGKLGLLNAQLEAVMKIDSCVPGRAAVVTGFEEAIAGLEKILAERAAATIDGGDADDGGVPRVTLTLADLGAPKPVTGMPAHSPVATGDNPEAVVEALLAEAQDKLNSSRPTHKRKGWTTPARNRIKRSIGTDPRYKALAVKYQTQVMEGITNLNPSSHK